MELEKCGDGDHSTEIELALKRFEDVCNSLEDEHCKLLELEKRRQKLNDDLECLRNEIKKEKDYFHSAIGDPFVEELKDVKGCSDQLDELVEPINLDTGAIKEFIKNQREELTALNQELDVEQLKDLNLKHYEKNERQGARGEVVCPQLDTYNSSGGPNMLNVDKDNGTENFNSTELADHSIDYLTSDKG